MRQALERRAEHLVRDSLAERQGARISFARNLIETRRHREVEALGGKLARETGLPFRRGTAGEFVSGTYQQRLTLASGRFAMIADGPGFQLVPWTPLPSKHNATAWSRAPSAAMAASTGVLRASAGSGFAPEDRNEPPCQRAKSFGAR
jgi:hypothetical protein